MNKHYGNIILITGASSGIGLASAQIFAQAGYTVWSASRHCDEGTTKFGSGEIRTIRMDVCDEASITSAVSNILAESGEIGIVLHCAGWGIAGACEDTPIEDVQAEMDTNYFGVLRVNSAVLPAMRKQGYGLVLGISSVAAVFSIPFQGHYCSTKRALESYIEALRMETRRYGIRASIIQPGDTKTKFTGARKFSMPDGSPYEQQCRVSVAVMEHDEMNGRAPESVARVALKLAGRKNPPVVATCGFDYTLARILSGFMPKRLVLKVLGLMYKVKNN